jgi:hypothetical protein
MELSAMGKKWLAWWRTTARSKWDSLAADLCNGRSLCANAHISESRYGAPDSVAQFRCGPPAGTKCHVAVKAKDYIFHPYQKR